MTEIDWLRVAEPQEDGYDLRVTLDTLQQGHYAEMTPRAVPQDTALVWPEGRARFVRMADNITPSPDLLDLPADHVQVSEGIGLVDAWPVMRPLCAQLLVGVCPITSGGPYGGHGCTSGNFGDDFGWIYVTADSPWGLAEGIVHEMGHWKLRAFGVWFENWTDLLLLNHPSELYTSPVRKDMERPMGAVLHGQYSYVHVAAMVTAILKAMKEPTADDCNWVELQLDRITEGQLTLQAHARGTPDVGKPFLEGLDAWTSRVLEEGRREIAKRKITV